MYNQHPASLDSVVSLDASPAHVIRITGTAKPPKGHIAIWDLTNTKPTPMLAAYAWLRLTHDGNRPQDAKSVAYVHLASRGDNIDNVIFAASCWLEHSIPVFIELPVLPELPPGSDANHMYDIRGIRHYYFPTNDGWRHRSELVERIYEEFPRHPHLVVDDHEQVKRFIKRARVLRQWSTRGHHTALTHN